MSDREKIDELPDPVHVALDQPHLTPAELQQEVGDSEPWDEASEKDFPEDSEDLPD